jgi:CheY-like chemotaxis protein
VLDLSKIEAGRMELLLVDRDLRDILRRQGLHWAQQAEEKGLDLQIDIDETVPSRLRVDPVRLGQCISNLLSNAIKFTDRGGIVVQLSAELAQRGVTVSIAVSDTGIGIATSTVKKLFQPFSQAEESLARRFSGTGLGLVITRKIARLMGGDVTVTSREGRGSTFTLKFNAEVPDKQAARPGLPAKIAQPFPQPKQTQTRHILLVDDHPLNRRVGNLFLKPEGYRVTEAENGLEALQWLEKDSFDIVLLDIHMPVLDGIKTLKRIRASGKPWKNIPVIALTADAMSGDRDRYLAEGMNGYVSKPIEQRDLLAEIARLLGTEAPDADAAASAEPQCAGAGG